MNQNRKELILDLLEKEYYDAKPELRYSTPFELLVATILSAQCTDERVNEVTDKLFKKYNTPQDFANIDKAYLEKQIYSCGFYRNKSKNIIETSKILVDKYGGKVPSSIEELQKLPGVGRKTANVVASNAFGIDAIAVDTHVFRVSNRLGLVNGKDALDTEKQLMALIPKSKWSRAHHWLIQHGRRICVARTPKCSECFLASYCLYNQTHQRNREV
ncbi:MAG TPA: endonuclease III [Clostridiales bacterium]|nr:endonuclease III [Clostridiales bacterium]